MAMVDWKYRTPCRKTSLAERLHFNLPIYRLPTFPRLLRHYDATPQQRWGAANHQKHSTLRQAQLEATESTNQSARPVTFSSIADHQCSSGSSSHTQVTWMAPTCSLCVSSHSLCCDPDAVVPPLHPHILTDPVHSPDRSAFN